MTSTLQLPPAKDRTAVPVTEPCQLCGAAEFERIGNRDRRGRELLTVVCRSCGLVSHAVIPNDQTLAEYYAREYRQDYHREFQPSARRVIREWRRGQLLFQRLRPQLLPTDRILEIGSGIGCNLKPFELAGFETAGIEPGEGFCRYSREQLGCRVRQASLADLPAEPAFDLVLLVHVLEHLNSPRTALTKIRRMLREGGRLYVEVPNLAAPHPSLASICHFAHIYNFTPWTLIALGRVCGFDVEQVLSEPRSGNLAILFRVGLAVNSVPADLYFQTKAVLKSFDPWRYYLRPGYVLERVSRGIRQLSERFAAQQRLRQILDICQP